MLIYLSLVAPLLGTGISISLTEGLYIPTFIMSVITETPLYNAVYILALIVFFIAGFLNAFVLQGIIIDGLSVKASMKQSVSLIRKKISSGSSSSFPRRRSSSTRRYCFSAFSSRSS